MALAIHRWLTRISAPTSKKLYLGMFQGVQQLVDYTLRISAYIGGAWQPYGPGCTITWDSTAKMEWVELVPESMRVSHELLTVRAFPNPNDGRFSVVVSGVENGELLELWLLDIAGRQAAPVQRVAKGAGPVPVDAGLGLAKGVYLLEVRTANSRVVQRVVVR